ncbi:MAG: adenine phosphoribosyltransferase, partial [Solirubrobacteraceae bacterium]
MLVTDDLRALVRDIPDFPKPGIAFKDITPLMADPAALRQAVDGLAEHALPLRADCVLAAEARGFLLGPALALALG